MDISFHAIERIQQRMPRVVSIPYRVHVISVVELEADDLFVKH